MKGRGIAVDTYPAPAGASVESGGGVAVLEMVKDPLPQPEPRLKDTRKADTIYVGGPILTMEGNAAQYAEALAVKDGTILFVGPRAKALTLQGPGTRIVDLQGKTLLPGFIDAHGHAWMIGMQKLAANLLPPPDGKGKDIAALVAILKDWQATHAKTISRFGWIIGFGYDDSQLAENRHPEATDLDKVSTEVPVLLLHLSGHVASLNHKALELAGLTSQSKDPIGGLIRREKDGRTPNGVLEEMAAFGVLFRFFATLDEEANEKLALAGVDTCVGFGFSTAQEGRASADVADTWRKLAREGRLPIDVVAFPDLESETDYMLKHGSSRSYSGRFRIGGVKTCLDGPVQSKTAWLTRPYLVPPPGEPKDYAGYPAFSDASKFDSLVDLAFKHNWPSITRCNGDAAIDQLISAVEKATRSHGTQDRRPVLIHGHTVRADQLARMKELGMIPSLFSAHTFYWGDRHRDETLGRDRASRISPTATALKMGMRFTQHHDLPMASPSAIMILHTTVNRTSRSGDVIGADERVSPYVALKSITDWAAYQYFEEDRKGTLTAGKLADLVILDKDPTKVAPTAIKDIQVLETIKEGKTVFKK